MKEPRLCMSSLSHGPIATWSQSSDPKNSIWAPPWLNRGLNSFCHTSFYYDSDKYRAPTSCSVYKSSFHDIFLYSYTDTASVQAVTVAETCINIYRATYSKCSSQYSCAFRESRRQCSRAVRFLELWSRGPEFNLLPNRLQDLSLFVPISNPNTVTLVCSRKFGILNLACHNVNRLFTANGITPVKPASKLLMSFSKTQSFLFFYAFSFILLYVAVPSPPENVTVITKTSRVVNISWTHSFNGNSDILNYTVEISTDNQTFTEARCQGLSSSGCVVSSTFTSASLVDLHPGRTYYIRVFATNKVGVSAVSSVITTTTDEEGKKIVK